MRPSACFLFLVLAAFISTSCSTEGALGQSQSSPECSPSDLVCAVQGLDGPLAAGTTLPIDISLDLQGSAAPPITLISADETVFSVNGVLLHGKGPGLATLLVTIPGNLVVDFFHVWVEQPTAIELHRRSDNGADAGAIPGKLDLLVGDEIIASVETFAGSQKLLGEPEATWQSGSEAVQILDEGRPGRRRLVAREPGSATIQVEAFGAKTQLPIEVLP